MELFIFVQCKEWNSKTVGTFLAPLNMGAISPVFESLADLYPWMQRNGYASDPKRGPWAARKLSTLDTWQVND